jgi:hypothetical protein
VIIHIDLFFYFRLKKLLGVSQASAPGRSTMPGVGSMSQFRASLWSNVEKLIDLFHDICAQIVQLQRILIKKRDVLLTTYSMVQQADSSENIALNKLLKQKIVLSSNSLNDDALPVDEYKYNEYEQTLNNNDDNDDDNADVPNTNQMGHQSQQSVEFLYEYWRILVNILSTNLNQVCIQSNYIKQTFHNEYPKLLKLYNDLWLRIVQLNPLIERYIYLSPQSNRMFVRLFLFRFAIICIFLYRLFFLCSQQWRITAAKRIRTAAQVFC